MAIRGAPVVDWTGRFEELAARETALAPGELDDLGQAAWFIGRDDVSARAWERAHLAYLDAGDLPAAVRCVFWLGFTLSEQGQEVLSRTWMGRLYELCARPDADRRTDAFRGLCDAVVRFAEGDMDGSVRLYRAAADLAAAVGDGDLDALATMGLGHSLVKLGRVEEGFASLDRVMLMIGSGRVSDRAAGPAFCAVVAGLLARGDLERARVWTRDLGDWCDSQHGLEPFRGECTLHRATVMQLGGEWKAAAKAADQVCRSDKRVETIANAWYRAAELHRVAGRAAAARDAFRQAAALGREVQPGLALLHRDAGELETAWAGLSRARSSLLGPAERAEVLAAVVAVALDRGRIADAHTAAEELAGCAESFDSLSMRALAAQAQGEIALREGRPAEALAKLRAAWLDWRHLDAPHQAALVRVAIGSAARAAGDEEGALLEFDAARAVLEGLGAVPDLARLERLAATTRREPADPGLSRREREVLELVARGWSNRHIAERLFLSDRTVARHVGSILSKLDVPSRSAATAYAFAHGLVSAV
ncbi:response regulator transcription factor [Microbacterium capsulatum]|uniref:Response regulator transcription factor n=1 Tax=Microbacterium capsulatum TaxID=3041921 RepID=A0ABU0XL08_9MICO|nr:response regulator transcription factor [Microbacterium sp. ASV81]MDQ4215804.1 response regulator transcription factor [Microbacterium sp. ASV81]